MIRDASEEEIAKKHGITVNTLHQVIERCKKNLLAERESRTRPRLDDKILTSWNALMITALAEAYRYLGEKEYLKLARETSSFVEKNMMKKDGSLYHNHKEGKSTIEGFLEDYANLTNTVACSISRRIAKP